MDSGGINVLIVLKIKIEGEVKNNFAVLTRVTMCHMGRDREVEFQFSVLCLK